MSANLKNNPPRAYRVGHQDFYGRDFYVTPDVLIPRPETEQLIDEVLTLAGQPFLPGVKPPQPLLPSPLTILDVGTGSGCIAITLSLELPQATVYASDISKAALRIARKNAKKHGAPIIPIISHLLEKVNTSPVGATLRASTTSVGATARASTTPVGATARAPFSHNSTPDPIPIPDLIAANLPYVDRDWPWLDLESLSFEPATALFAADHGLALIKSLIIEAAERRIPYLVLEADPIEHTEITKFAKRHHYQLIRARGYILSFSFGSDSDTLPKSHSASFPDRP